MPKNGASMRDVKIYKVLATCKSCGGRNVFSGYFFPGEKCPDCHEPIVWPVWAKKHSAG